MSNTADVGLTMAHGGGVRGVVPPGQPSGGQTTGSAGRAHADARQDARARGDTRARIQQVAIELFTEHGYEGTSLREIAERLDVTKAALYYHFRSKEDIIRSLVEDYYGQIDALIAWGQQQPRSAEVQREVISRYARIIADGDQVFRMLHQNQASVNALAAAKNRSGLFKERMQGLIEVLAGPEAPLVDRVRAAMALGAISVGWMFFSDQVPDQTELADVVRGLATEFALTAVTAPS